MPPLGRGGIYKLTNSKKCKKLTQLYVVHGFSSLALYKGITTKSEDYYN